MRIVLHLSDLLHELFPHDQGDTEALLVAMKAYYRVGGVEPKVTLQGDMVVVEVDEQRIAGVERLFQDAWSDCVQGRFAKAKPKLLQLVAQDPTNGNTHAILGQVCSELGEQEEAMDHLIEALRWDPTNHRALLMMGNIWAKHRREPETALTYLREALKVQPDDHIAATNIGSQLLELKRMEEAKGYLEQAIGHAPEFPNTRLAMAELLQATGDPEGAFEQAILCARLSKLGEPLHGVAVSLATELAQQLIEGPIGHVLVQDLATNIAERMGKPVLLKERADLGTAAKLEVAEYHGRAEHWVLCKPGYPAVEHLQVHELYHLCLIMEARNEGANMQFTSNPDHHAAFRTSVLPTLRKLRNDGVPEEAAEGYINALFNGLLLQVYNAPIDLFIEYDMHRVHSMVRPYQFLSLARLVHEAVLSCTDPQALRVAPPMVASANRVYNVTLAMLLKELYGMDRVPDMKASAKELQLATKLYDEFKEYRDDRQPGEEYEVVRNWARDLQLEDYFALVPERSASEPDTTLDAQLRGIEADPIGTYEEDPEKVRQMERFLKAHQAGDTNPAMVMYMVDALNYFSDKPKDQIQKTAFEIAMLGTQGIHPEKQGYKLALVPGVTFSGYHLLAYYYVSFKRALPQLLPELKLPFDDEYALAEQFSRESK